MTENNFKIQKSKLKDNKERQKCLEKEKEIYHMSGIKKEFINTQDMFLDKETYMHYTIVSKTKKEENNILFLIHGYGGMGCIYYKLIKELSKKFYIIIIDLPGMSFNYRDKNVEKYKTHDEWLNYFLGNIDLFINKLGIDRFNLLGHSLGGYIAGHYFNKYSEKIIKLFLSSPAGFNPSHDENLKEHNDRINNFNFFKRIIVKKALHDIYEKKKTHFNYMYWPFRKLLLKLIFSRKKFLVKKEKKNLVYILNYFFSQKQYSEKCLGYLLEHGVKGRKSIFNIILEKNKFIKNICIFYGENDWMDFKETQKNLKISKLKIELHFIPKAGHGLNLENPEFVSEKILCFCKL